MKKQVSADLVAYLLDLFVPVFIEKEVDASSSQRYTSSTLGEDNKEVEKPLSEKEEEDD